MSSVERQKGLTTSHTNIYLDLFTCKRTILLFCDQLESYSLDRYCEREREGREMSRVRDIERKTKKSEQDREIENAREKEREVLTKCENYR